ncbi:hypothetical protein ABFA07_008500 [Porites harrisoni]
MKATSLDNSQACYGDTSVPVLHVTLLGGEWGSSAGGLSTINRELAIHLSNHSAVKISLLVPEGACNTEEIREADGYGITIVEAKERPAYDRLDWLSIPPQDHFMDIVVGHGVKLGRQVQFIRDSAQFSNCKWVQVVHTAPEDLSRYKCYSDPISKGETKHESEVGLCKLADLVVPVGPRLKEAYCSYLQRCKTDQDVLSITPGLFQREFGDLVAKQEPNKDGEFKVLLFGRGDDEDFELKGYNIAAQAFTDQRLNNKCYHLIFVGAPEGKQEEVREKLLQRGIVQAQLTVRKFMQSRERLKDLLCEADIAIMPSKSEGFGLVALEALSAGLPILVGSRSGFAKALENVLHGDACIVNSDDPAEWAKAIEAVRLKHGRRLQEIKSLRASYGEMYSWKEQCEALVNRMRRMGHDASDIPKDVSVTEKQPVAKTHASASGFSGEQCPVDEQPKTEDLVRLSEESPSTCHTPSISGLTSDQEAENTIKMSITPRGLSSELEDVVDRMFRQQLEVYLKYNKRNKLSTASGLSDFFKHVEDTYNFSLTCVGMGSLVIKGQCPDLLSLENLWNDYCSGVLNEAAERFLVTDDMKKEINLVTLRLKTTIEEESYLTCKKALMEKSAISRSVPPTTESDQEAASPLIDTSPDDSEVHDCPPLRYQMASQVYSEEQLNYFRVCHIATDILPPALRLLFKQEWDNRYKATYGEWKDTPQNGLDFKNGESPGNQRKNARLLATMANGDRAEWDCTMLFYAILFSDSIHGLSPMIRTSVDDLRKFRNEDFAHMTEGQLSNLDFSITVAKVETAFQALGLSTDDIQTVSKQKSFPTDELQNVKTSNQKLTQDLQTKDAELQDKAIELDKKTAELFQKDVELQEKKDKLHERHTELQEKEAELQENKDRLKTTEEQRKVFEEQLQREVGPFCVLPPRPPHVIASRDSDVAMVSQKLTTLRKANVNSLSFFYISGNPGSGKSQLAGLVAENFYKEARKDTSAPSFVMTLNAQNLESLLESYFSLARKVSCPAYTITSTENSKDLNAERKIAIIKDLIATKIHLYSSWLLVIDNVTNLARMAQFLPERGNEQWGKGQLLITTQDCSCIPPESSITSHLSISKGMIYTDVANLLFELTGITDDGMGKKVAHALDYQPLALASAGVYVRKVRNTNPDFGWEEYLQKLEKGKRERTEEELTKVNNIYPNSMTEATRMAVKEEIDSNEIMKHAFTFLALSAPEPVRLHLLTTYVVNADGELDEEEIGIQSKVPPCC